MKKRPKPKFDHECEECVFLGRDIPRLPHERDFVDMYAHGDNGVYQLWRRYGDDESEVQGITFSSHSTDSAFSFDEAWKILILKVSN